jgi:hypothetical protein
MALCLVKHRNNFTFTLPWLNEVYNVAVHRKPRILIIHFHIWGCIQRFRTGLLERELPMVLLSATRCSCIAVVWVSLVSFVAITLCVASQRVSVALSVYFVIDSVRELLVTPSYTFSSRCIWLCVSSDFNFNIFDAFCSLLHGILYRYEMQHTAESGTVCCVCN